MLTTRLVARLVLSGLAGLALAPRPAVAADSVAPEPPHVVRWLPADPGNRWTYVYTRERRRVMDGAQENVESMKGMLVDQVVATAPQVAPGAVEIQSTLRGREESAAADVVETRRVVLSSGGAGFRVFEREAPNPLTGEQQRVRFSPPLEGLEVGAKPSEPWRAGVAQAGDLRIEYQAEILGVQDAQTPAGLYEKCLVVRTTANMTGTVHVDGQAFDLDGGTSVTTEWYAPGVGRVLAKHELDQKLRMASGAIIQIDEKAQFALSSVELAASGSGALPAAPTASPAPTAAPDSAPTSP